MQETPMISLSMVSHELKNPLTLVHSTLQLIGSRYEEVQKDPLWTQVLFDINYMSKLLSEISSLNSIQTLNYSQINIRQILTNVVQSFFVEAGNQKKHILIHYETTLKLMEADGIKIQELVRNLIQNAMDATKAEDVIEITVQSKWDRLILIVQDTGCGMESEQLETIFEPFVTYKKGGTGLGLSIVRNIIEAHQGVIRVYSKPFAGTKFVLILPVHAPQMKNN